MSGKVWKMAAGTCGIVLLNLAAMAARPHHAAQAAANSGANPGHVVGAITSLTGNTIEIRTDQGTSYAVSIPAGVKLLRVEPGAKTLGNAQAIAVGDMGIGDRVLVRLAAGDSAPFAATSVIDIPHAAIVARQREEQMEWQMHGVGGLVKSVDAASGTIVLTTGAGKTSKEVTLKTNTATVLRRYAADSVDYSKATVAPLSAIQPGDQLRALLDATAAGPDKVAREIVSGSFRNVAGRISNVNSKAETITLRDLMTRKNVTVHINAVSQMRQLTAEQANQIAAATKGIPAGHGMGQGAGAMHPGAPGQMGAGQMGAGQMGAGQGQGGWQRPAGMASGAASGAMHAKGAGAAPGGMDPQQILRRATVIQLKDLHKGDAVMLVGTAGGDDVTAITLLSGVEPLLESSASTQNALMANWSMGSGSDQSDATQ